MRVRGIYRGKQLQHILANTQREEDFLGSGQQRKSEAHADTPQSAAGESVTVRPHAHQAVGRAQAVTLPAAETPRQTEKASAPPQELPHASTETEPAA